MSMKIASFIRRSDLVSFHDEQSRVLIDESMASGEVGAFLARYYNNRVPRDILDGVRYRLLGFEPSGMIFQEVILNEYGMEELYENWIDAAESLSKRTQADGRYYFSLARQVQGLLRYFAPRKPNEIKVLDFGMGWGHWAHMAAAHGLQAFGAELSARRIQHAQTKGIKVITDIGKIEADSFNFVNCEQVMEHVTDPLGILKELARLVSPGGIVRIAVPPGDGMMEAIKAKSYRIEKGPIQPLEHINCYSSAAIAKLATLSGLRSHNYVARTKNPMHLFISQLGALVSRRETGIYYFTK